MPDVPGHALADALTSFLNALARPVVPAALLPEKDLADADKLRAFAADFLGKLPDHNYNTFVYVLAFFKDLLSSPHDDDLSPAKLSAVACGAMLPNDDRGGPGLDRATLYAKHNMNTVVQYFLTSPLI